MEAVHSPPVPRRRRFPVAAVLFTLALVTSAWAWWVIAWPVAALAEPAKHAGHFALVYVHVLGGTVMLFVGAANLYVGWTRRQFRYHRALGYTYLAGGGVGAVVALVLALSNVHGASGAPFAVGLGQAGDIGISTATLALAWLGASAMALRAVRNRRIEAHRAWMIRSYVLTWTFVLCRIASRVPALEGIGTSDASLVWVSWVVPMLVCEVALQWRETGRKPALPAARPAVPVLRT